MDTDDFPQGIEQGTRVYSPNDINLVNALRGDDVHGRKKESVYGRETDASFWTLCAA